MAKTGGETSTGSRNFYCPSRTAANVLSIAGTSDAVKLAEVVIVGAAWSKFDCKILSWDFQRFARNGARVLFSHFQF